MLTAAVESIVVQLVACPTVTKETADGVTAQLFTASIAYITLIDIYTIQMHYRMFRQISQFTYKLYQPPSQLKPFPVKPALHTQS